MPAVSSKQRKLFAIALAMKRGEVPYSYSEEAAKLAKTLSEKKLREFAKTPKRKKTKEALARSRELRRQFV